MSFNLEDIPHRIEDDKLIVDPTFDLSQIKSLIIDGKNDSSIIEYANDFLKIYEEELCNLEKLKAFSYFLTFIPKSVRILDVSDLCTDQVLVLENLDLNYSKRQQETTINLDPINIRRLKFSAMSYHIPNLNEMINLEKLAIYHTHKEPEIVSDKLIELSIYNGIVELPSSIKILEYVLDQYNYSFKYLQLERLFLTINKNINCDMENPYLKNLFLDIRNSEMNNISFNFPVLKDLTINFWVDTFDEIYIYEFLSRYELNVLSMLNNTGKILNVCKEWIFDYEIIELEIENIVLNLIFKNKAYYTFGSCFTDNVQLMHYKPDKAENEIEFDSNTVEEINVELTDNIDQIIKIKFYCQNLKKCTIINHKFVNKSKIYLTSFTEFKIDVTKFTNLEIYFNDELIGEKDEN